MFNLIVISREWNSRGGQKEIESERLFEYTDDNIRNDFTNEETVLLDRLSLLPCLFMNEGDADQVAYVGNIESSEINNRIISFSYTVHSDLPQLNNRLIYQNRNELGISNDFEFSRNHWAIKNIDLYPILFRSLYTPRQLPSVFNLEQYQNINGRLVSAMMPFDTSFDQVYKSIQDAASQNDLDCDRADDIWENAEVIQDVVSLIDQSCVVVCDCTNKNPNVFYEAGIAHTLGRDVILITQNDNDIPFDLRHLRYIKYLNNDQGLEELGQQLQRRLNTLVSRQEGV